MKKRLPVLKNLRINMRVFSLFSQFENDKGFSTITLLCGEI